MFASSHVLFFGNDLMLLETREWILAKAGFQAERATTLDEVERKIAAHRPDVLVLCHTLSREECRRVGQIAQRGWPLMKTLVLATRASGCVATATDAILNIPADPLRLIRSVQDLISRDLPGAGSNAVH